MKQRLLNKSEGEIANKSGAQHVNVKSQSYTQKRQNTPKRKSILKNKGKEKKNKRENL